MCPSRGEGGFVLSTRPPLSLCASNKLSSGSNEARNCKLSGEAQWRDKGLVFAGNVHGDESDTAESHARMGRYFSQMWSHIVCCLSWAAPPMKVSGAALSPRLSAMPLQFYCSPFQSSCLAQRYMIKAALFSSVKRKMIGCLSESARRPALVFATPLGSDYRLPLSSSGLKQKQHRWEHKEQGGGTVAAEQ
ncbi:hypothetical protein NQZ68_004201 [Dissostichus eleginoides]|nr:hypothetical protein NQZ68_004201 [Dissostichus eleginoides]